MNLGSGGMLKAKDTQNFSKVLGIVVPVAGIVISILIAFMVIWPKIQEIQELRESNVQLAQRAELLENKAEILASLDHNKLEEQLAAAEQLLPSDTSIFAVLGKVEDTANTTGILLNSISTDPSGVNAAGNRRAVTTSPESSLAPAVVLSLAISGDYQSLMRFVGGLYSYSRVVSIDTMTISAGGGEGGQLSTSFGVNAHWKGLPSNLGSIEAPVQKLTQAEEELLEKVRSPEKQEIPPVPDVPKGRGDPFTPY